ncbi:MAG TPA: GntR family transcriptional regulator [Solirubrobacteraceae bacterium]|nr:GntR family transcriptional regulator [Solirubrobacteraceae bacterium]
MPSVSQAGSRAAGSPGRDARRPVSATTTAYRHAKERLLDGRFPAGQLLSENELARELGISRTPVREAFLLLEAEGLLELYPRRGALVTPISPTEADDLLEARLLTEAHCAGAVTAPDPALDAALAETIDAQRRALADDDRVESHLFTVADREFHRAIVVAHGNPILTRQYDALRDRQQRISALATARSRERIAQFIAEHGEIAAALGAGDGQRARELVESHLRAAHELARGARR